MDLEEKIKARITELETYKQTVIDELQREAEIRLAPINAALGELMLLLSPENKEQGETS
jgi:hypothetical protein